MYIKTLELSNFQVIRNYKGNFEGNVYFITGDNEVGKSTLLKAIKVLLTGERDQLLTNGEKKGFAKMVVGNDGENYEVELRFTEANPRGTISIKSSQTGMKSDNISMLQKIFAYQDFDAVEFSRWSETAEGRRRQIAVVKSLLPAKVQKRITEIDSEVESVKEARKGDNSSLKSATSLLEAAERAFDYQDVSKYEKPIEISDLMEQQKVDAQLIEKAKTVREKLALRIKTIESIPGKIQFAEQKRDLVLGQSEDIAKNAKDDYEKAIQLAKKNLADSLEHSKNLKLSAEESFKIDVSIIESEQDDAIGRKKAAEDWLVEYEANSPENSDINEKILKADEHNKKHRLAIEYKEKLKTKKEIEAKIEKHETKLSNLLSEREKLITESKLPIEGLTFTDDGLELNGVQFVEGKVSDSQIMEVAAKLIIASNPKVKVFRIARGESLGESRLQALLDLAKKSNYQGFIEEVHRGQDSLAVEQYISK